MKTIVLTGGHLTPALAVIEILQKQYPDLQLVFIGRLTVFEGIRVQSQEERIMKSLNIPFYPLTAGRIRMQWSVASLISAIKIPIGIIQAWILIMRLRPSLIIAFGGYVGFPVALAGKLIGTKVLVHEQTVKPGFANALAARFADTVCISFQESRRNISTKHIVYTGLPLRSALYDPPGTVSIQIVEPERKILYIMGGATGSVTINSAVLPVLPALLKTYTIVHQTGTLDYERVKAYRLTLTDTIRRHYHIFSYIDTPDHAWILHHASMVISRSGANTVAELLHTKTPSLVIPLARSRGNEQFKNAQMLVKSTVSKILTESELTAENIIRTVALLTGTKKPQVNQTGRKNQENLPSRVIADIASKMLLEEP